MREVEFRTIDKLFIKMSINDKIWVIFLLFLVTLTSVAGSRYFNDIQQFEEQSILTVEAKLAGIVQAQPQSLANLNGVVSTSNAGDATFNNGTVTAYAKLNSGQAIQLTENLSRQFEQAKSDALTSFFS